MYRSARLGMGLAFGCSASYALQQRYLAAKEEEAKGAVSFGDTPSTPAVVVSFACLVCGTTADKSIGEGAGGRRSDGCLAIWPTKEEQGVDDVSSGNVDAFL